MARSFSREELFEQALAEYGPALKRLARAYEFDAQRREDVLQEIHFALWQSLDRFDGRCALGTWVYRVAHNAATSWLRRRRTGMELVSIEDIDLAGIPVDREQLLDDRRGLDRILEVIHRLKPTDRQVMLLYLEGVTAGEIGDVVGLSASNVATKIHRLKKLLSERLVPQGRV